MKSNNLEGESVTGEFFETESRGRSRGMTGYIYLNVTGYLSMQSDK